MSRKVSFLENWVVRVCSLCRPSPPPLDVATCHKIQSERLTRAERYGAIKTCVVRSIIASVYYAFDNLFGSQGLSSSAARCQPRVSCNLRTRACVNAPFLTSTPRCGRWTSLVQAPSAPRSAAVGRPAAFAVRRVLTWANGQSRERESKRPVDSQSKDLGRSNRNEQVEEDAVLPFPLSVTATTSVMRRLLSLAVRRTASC